MKITVALLVVAMLTAGCGRTYYVGTQEYTDWVIENGR